MRLHLTADQISRFHADGFVLIRDVLDADEVACARSRFAPMFAGSFETGLQPDEWNWRDGESDPTLTRQICNGWKSDRAIARLVLDAQIGEALARLRGWPGARINQDNMLWKPPGGRSLGFHQDDSYQHWITPARMMTCWMTLDDCSAETGSVEYVRGSHLWPIAPPAGQFHGPDDRFVDMRVAAASAGISTPEVVAITARAGSAVLHHGRTWHGSGPNRTHDQHRRALVSHCMSSETRFHPTETHPIYSRYRQAGTDAMDESFFPILWREDGARSSGID